MQRLHVIIFTALVSLPACQTAPPIPQNTIKNLTSCSISLVQAKKNLLSRGYAITLDKRAYFSTDYKRSRMEDINSLLTNDVLLERNRMFTVYALNPKKVNFSYKYQVVYHDKPGLISQENPDFTRDRLSIYEKIRNEVCAPTAESKPRRKKSSKKRG